MRKNKLLWRSSSVPMGWKRMVGCVSGFGFRAGRAVQGTAQGVGLWEASRRRLTQ